MKQFKKWFVIGENEREIHDGLTEKQAVRRHTFGKGSRDYHVIVATSPYQFAPKGRKPRENEALVAMKNGEIISINCNVRSLYKFISGQKILSE